MNIQNQTLTINEGKLKSEIHFFEYEKTEKNLLLRSLFTLINRERDKTAEKVLRDVGYETINFNECFGYINVSMVEDSGNGQRELQKGDLVLTPPCLQKYCTLLNEKGGYSKEIFGYVIRSKEIHVSMLLLPFLCAAIGIYHQWDMEYEDKFIMVGDSLVMKLLKIVVNEYRCPVRHIRNVVEISEEMMIEKFSGEAVFYAETQTFSPEEEGYLKQKNITVYNSRCFNFDIRSWNNREIRSEAEKLICAKSLNLNEFIGYHVHAENIEMILDSTKDSRDKRMIVFDW